MKKIIFALVVLALLVGTAPAQATRVYHIYKTPRIAKLTSVSKYGYVYHRLATIKCPFAGCRSQFTH